MTGYQGRARCATLTAAAHGSRVGDGLSHSGSKGWRRTEGLVSAGAVAQRGCLYASAPYRRDQRRAMSVIITCDYCGDAIEDGMVATIKVHGNFPDDDGRSRYHSFTFGEYHTAPNKRGEHGCYWRIKDAMNLAEGVGPSLEHIPTISGQAVAARRRKHRHEGGES